MKKIRKYNLIKSVLNKITLNDGGVILFFKFSLAFFIVFFTLQSVFVQASNDEEEIEEDIEDLLDEKEDLEKDVEKTETEIDAVNREIYSTQAVIKKTSQKIEEYEETIEGKEKHIKDKEGNIKFKQQILAEYLRLFRRNSLELGLITFDSKQDLGEYLREIESFEDFQDKIGEALAIIEQEKKEIVEEKEKLEKKKDEKEEALETQEKQKQHLVYQENQKKNVLARTKSSISEVNSKISKLKTELSSLLGEKYDTGDIKDAIKYANKKTGVSKGFLFGMLSMESGLGRYTGGCTYDKVKFGAKAALKDGRLSQSSYDRMKRRKDIFEDIVDELGYDEDKKLVSCNPAGYNGTGGAMGVAQFMSDTWSGWKSRIASATGNQPPDPWDLVDGVIAMALKLEEDGAAKSGDVRITTPYQKGSSICTGKKIYVDWEDYAAMKYLGWSCYALTNYAPGIQNLKDGYDDL